MLAELSQGYAACGGCFDGREDMRAASRTPVTACGRLADMATEFQKTSARTSRGSGSRLEAMTDQSSAHHGHLNGQIKQLMRR
jgi:hypothetical protein